MELVENVYVSDFTKKTLEQFGWKAGDPIPAELGQVMVQMKEALPGPHRPDVLLDAGALSADQTERITSMLTKAREVGQRKEKERQLDEQTKTMTPEVAEAYRKILAEEEAGPQIIDDRNEPPAPPPVEPEPQPVAEPEPEPRLTNSGLGVLPQPFCPRCGWDTRQKFESIPDEQDKEKFLVTVLGEKRFTKTYEIFGGKYVITFRTLLADESKLIYRQLLLDQQEKRVNSEAEWLGQLFDYRLACSLETIVTKDGQVVASLPTLSEMPMLVDPQNPLKTNVPKQLELLNKAAAQEATRRIIATHLRYFQRLVEALEAMALEPSFWNGID
jgi:hypothetical protein